MEKTTKAKKKKSTNGDKKKDNVELSPTPMLGGLIGANPFSNFGDIASETNKSPYFGQLNERFSDASRTFGDRLAYSIENAISADNNVKFYVLIYLSVFFFFVFSACWHVVSRSEEVHDYSLGGIFFVMFQILISCGYDDSIVETDERIIYIMACAVG